MPISDKKLWKDYEDKNKDPYGGCCVKVARRAMEILDEEAGDFDTHELICRANKKTNTGGISGFMAGCVAWMIVGCHSRGEEFRKKWNKDNQIGTEGDKANEKGGILNPALINLG